MRSLLLLGSLMLLAGSASAQLPGLRKYTPSDNRGQGAPVLQGIEALRADFAAQSGGTTLYFANGSATLVPAARILLAAQASWLRHHPDVLARVEGYGDSTDSRDHALAMGARRAEQAREYLILLGVPSAQVSLTSWGRERLGLGRAVTILIR